MIWIFWDWFKYWISFLSALLLNVQPNYTYKEDISNGRDVRMSLDVMLKHQSIIKCLKKFIQWVQTDSTLSLKNYLTLCFLGILNAYNWLPLTLYHFIANTFWRRCLYIFDIFLFIHRPTTFAKTVLLKSFVFLR